VAGSATVGYVTREGYSWMCCYPIECQSLRLAVEPNEPSDRRSLLILTHRSASTSIIR
jgi:hypothetical protein